MKRISSPTLEDVAREASVTIMAASVVLNGARSSARVSEATGTRIREAAVRLGYRRNAAARGLFRRRMETIGVVAQVGDGGDVNFYFLALLNGILEAAAARGQNTTVFSIKGWDAEAGTDVQSFCDGRVDGLILIGPRLPASVGEEMRRHTPFVCLHSDTPLPGGYHIDCDDEDGGYQAVRHLIALGHRRIAHFGGEGRNDAARRFAGYRRALAEAGIAEDAAPVLHGYLSFSWGRQMATRLLEMRDAAENPATFLPTAIFCANDAIAFGGIEIFHAAGLRVPEDISVIGFDDTITANMSDPPLTTVRQPLREMGTRAVVALLEQIESVNPSPEEDKLLNIVETCPVELVHRASVAPPPDPSLRLIPSTQPVVSGSSSEGV